MSQQKDMYRIFHLIRLLNTPPAKDVPQLVRQVGDTSMSAVYRNIKLLEDLGYPVQKNEQHRYFLEFAQSTATKGVLEPIEIQYLQELLQQFGGKSPHAEKILHQFNQHLSLIPLADALPQLHISRMTQLIRAGIQSQRCLQLHRYRSLTSQTTSNRRVAPLELTADSRYLIAWDLDKDDQRQFKIERIEDIDLLEETIAPGRIASPMDLFGLTGEAWLSVQLQLSDTARHLMVEEFPLSRPQIRQVNGQWIFDGQVRHWKGIGRFVLGLPGEVTVLGPAAFVEYLEGKRQKK